MKISDPLAVRVEKEYIEHKAFSLLDEYIEFYDSLSYHIMNWSTRGTLSILNIDTHMLSSSKGTLESIKDILIKGKLNDAYALLRKYYDSIIINIYLSIRVEENQNNLIVEEIDNWVKDKTKIPDFETMVKAIGKSQAVEGITSLFDKSAYKTMRNRFNNHVHYNYYSNLLLNNNWIDAKKRLFLLEEFSTDLNDIFILHFSCFFYVKQHYMMSEDYEEALDLGLEPDDGMQYLVAPFIQQMFDKVIKTKRPDIATKIKNKISMKLE